MEFDHESDDKYGQSIQGGLNAAELTKERALTDKISKMFAKIAKKRYTERKEDGSIYKNIDEYFKENYDQEDVTEYFNAMYGMNHKQ